MEKMAEENGSCSADSQLGSQENLAADAINLEIEEVKRIPSLLLTPSCLSFRLAYYYYYY